MPRKTKFVPTADFGKDHWSLLAYIETRCVDHKGEPQFEHLRCHPRKHPHYRSSTCVGWQKSWGTRLAGFFLNSGRKNFKRQLPTHDDWDCFDDLERAGYVENIRSGANPLWKLTKLGIAVAHKLRELKMDGGNFADFKI